MDRTAVALLVCAALWGAPSSAFFQDLLLPLQEAKQALLHPQPAHPPPQQPYPQPQPLPQPLPQYPPQYPTQYSYQPQYRRSMYDAPVQQGYAYTRPATYQQWVQPASQPRPLSYDVGTAYSYGGSNPFSTFWQQQSSWLPQGLPWLSNRQQVQQQVQQAPVVQVQPLSAVAAPQQPQLVAQPALPAQPQPPLQGIWGFLPWSGNYQAAAGTGGNNPVISFFQNQAALLPWNQQGHQVAARPVVYTTPLAPSPAAGHAGHGQGAASLQLSADLPVATLSSSASPLPSDGQDVKPDGLVLDDIVTVQSLADNGIRRIHQDGTPCA